MEDLVASKAMEIQTGKVMKNLLDAFRENIHAGRIPFQVKPVQLLDGGMSISLSFLDAIVEKVVREINALDDANSAYKFAIRERERGEKFDGWTIGLVQK